MDLSRLKPEERYEMMRKRHAYFTDLASSYTSFSEFRKEQDMFFAIMGVELYDADDNNPQDYMAINIELGMSDYETYFLVKDADGHLVCSHIIMWQDDYCANSYLNIMSEKTVHEKEILRISR